MSRHGRDLRQLTVQWVVLDGAFDGTRLTHETRTMNDLDRLLRGESRHHQLSPAGEARHQMRFDEPETHAQVCADKPLIDPRRRAARGVAQEAMIRKNARVVILYAILAGNVL